MPVRVSASSLAKPAKRPVAWTDRIDKILTHRIWGTLIFLLVMFLVFESIFLIADPLKRVMDVGKNALADLVRLSPLGQRLTFWAVVLLLGTLFTWLSVVLVRRPPWKSVSFVSLVLIGLSTLKIR